jgi:putative transposase
MRPYKTSSHTVHDLKVHLIWITKYRYKVLVKDVGYRTRELIRQVCDGNNVQIIKGRVSKDHVHLYVSYPPKLSVSEMVRKLKGRSSRKIQEEFPQLGKQYWGKHFWAIGYAAFSSGHVTDEMIQECLEQHDKHSNHQDDDFKVE